MLHRTSNDNNETPDPSFWTAYDHLMVEREARVKRRKYVYGLIVRAWRNLERRWHGSPAVSGRTRAAR